MGTTINTSNGSLGNSLLEGFIGFDHTFIVDERSTPYSIPASEAINLNSFYTENYIVKNSTIEKTKPFNLTKEIPNAQLAEKINKVALKIFKFVN